MSDLQIRAARASDADAIAVLLEQLGYPAPPEDIPRRFVAVTSFSDAIAMVAEEGVPRIAVTSGKQRDRTHKFYQERGYEWTGFRFMKTLSETSRG